MAFAHNIATAALTGVLFFTSLTSAQTKSATSSPSAFDIYSQGDMAFYHQDYVKAMQFYRQAADLGYARAQADIGFLYSRGGSAGKHTKKSRYWFPLFARIRGANRLRGSHEMVLEGCRK